MQLTRSTFTSLTIRIFAISATCLCLNACETLSEFDDLLNPAQSTELGTSTIAAGLREALTVGAGRVVNSLGAENGFLDSKFHIPLPDKLKKAQEVAGRFGMSGIFDDLEVQLNRAAEAATPKARDLFVDAIKAMTFMDVMNIYQGADDAATQYLQRTTAEQLNLQMRPVVDQGLNQVGAVSTFKDLATQYNRLPLVKPVDADISGHVLKYASTALFAELAKEEAAIRNEPVKRTTELLRRVFRS